MGASLPTATTAVEMLAAQGTLPPQTYNLTPEQALQVMTQGGTGVHARLDAATHAAAIEAALGGGHRSAAGHVTAMDGFNLRADSVTTPGLRLNITPAADPQQPTQQQRLMDLSHRPASVAGMVDTTGNVAAVAGSSHDRSSTHDHPAGAHPVVTAATAMDTGGYEVPAGVDWYVATTPDNMQIYVPRTLAHTLQ